MGSNNNINKFSTIRTISNSFYLLPTTASEVYNIICNLNNSKGCGHDRIGNVVVKNNATFFSQLLTSLYNIVLERGIYPNCLKIARVQSNFDYPDFHYLERLLSGSKKIRNEPRLSRKTSNIRN